MEDSLEQKVNLLREKKGKKGELILIRFSETTRLTPYRFGILGIVGYFIPADHIVADRNSSDVMALGYFKEGEHEMTETIHLKLPVYEIKTDGLIIFDGVKIRPPRYPGQYRFMHPDELYVGEEEVRAHVPDTFIRYLNQIVEEARQTA